MVAEPGTGKPGDDAKEVWTLGDQSEFNLENEKYNLICNLSVEAYADHLKNYNVPAWKVLEPKTLIDPAKGLVDGNYKSAEAQQLTIMEH